MKAMGALGSSAVKGGQLTDLGFFPQDMGAVALGAVDAELLTMTRPYNYGCPYTGSTTICALV
jgi:hypothetical protein